MMDHDMAAHASIAALVNNWGFYRDQSRWASLRDTFHPEGTISISWIEAPHTVFVDVSEQAAASGLFDVKHLLGVPRISVLGERALSEVNVTIMVRGQWEGTTFDTTSHARFLDRVERRDGTFRVLQRTAIYERDRADVVGTGPLPTGLTEALDGFPPQVRHLAATFRLHGIPLAPGLVTHASPEAETLYQDAERWLQGAPE